MFESLLKDQANVTLASVPDGAESYALARILAESDRKGLALVFVAMFLVYVFPGIALWLPTLVYGR